MRSALAAAVRCGRALRLPRVAPFGRDAGGPPGPDAAAGPASNAGPGGDAGGESRFVGGVRVDRSGMSGSGASAPAPPGPGRGGPEDVDSTAPSLSLGAGGESRPELVRHLLALVRFGGGPLTVAEFMQHALTHPTGGYYMRRDVFGRSGDFTTSPEVSQLFGDVLGAWAVCVWQQMGRPAAIDLVELGPGRGTLMADMLRATRQFSDFAAAVRVRLVEISPPLRRLQRAALACVPDSSPNATDSSPGSEGATTPLAATPSRPRGAPVTWHDSLDAVPAAPAIFVAHELFDALPVHQFQLTPRGWCERLVAAAGAAGGPAPLGGARPEAANASRIGPFELVLSPVPTAASRALVPPRLKALSASRRAGIRVLEVCPAGQSLAAALAARCAAGGGAALIIDYGYGDETEMGDDGDDTGPGRLTLQGIRGHSFTDSILDSPGATDLSAYVDFSALSSAVSAAAVAATAHGPVPQGPFLRSLGLEQRMTSLQSRVGSGEKAAALRREYERLAGHGLSAGGYEGMGWRYKAMAIAADSLGMPPGFEVMSESLSHGLRQSPTESQPGHGAPPKQAPGDGPPG